MKLNIIYEDNHIIVINKESGVLSQGDRTGKDSLIQIIKKYIKEKYNKPGNVFLGLVHRIDKPVSGSIIYAKTSKAAARLQKEFLSKSIKKFYIALVPEIKNSSDSWIELNQHILKKRALSIIVPEGTENAKNASLRYKTIATSDGNTLLLIELHTGRKHQIRTQLSSNKKPILGDKRYSSKILFKDGSICLHSFFIRIKHPVKDEKIDLISEVPERFKDIFHAGKNINDIILDEIINSI